MMSRGSVCVIITTLYIGGVIAFSWKNVSNEIIACEGDVISIQLEYDLGLGEYVKAIKWFTGVNKTARRIANWKDTDGFTIESQYNDRVTMTGQNSLILRNVTTNDEGPYTLILLVFPPGSQTDPRLTVNLVVYISPLNEAGCCKPDIIANRSELRASFHSTLACGKPTPTLEWTNSRNKTVENDSLILGSRDRAGTYKVCAVGPAVDRCFKGVKDNLCKSYTVERFPEGDELKSHDSNHAMTIGVSVSVVTAVIIGAVVVTVFLYRRVRQRSRRRLQEQIPLINLGENVSGVKSLTLRLIDIYKERSQFQKADSDLKLNAKLNSGSSHEPDIDMNSYIDALSKRGEHLRRILITGEVGCGKETWCNSLTQDWCKAHSDHASDKDNANTKFLSNFKLLFNASLTKHEYLSNVNQLLTYFRIPLFDANNLDIGKHLLGHKAIFVIQGLEEYHGSPKDILNLLSDKRLQDSLIIVTSTPTLWDNTYKGLLSFDRIISVQGLDPEEMKKRAKRILHGHGFPPKAIDNFFFLLKERRLEEFTTDPVFFPYLVTMWQTNCSLPSNKAEFLLNVIENKIKDKGTSLAQDTSIYRSDIGSSPVFMHKEFTLHYGKIIQVIGTIAFNILCRSNQHVTFDAKEFDSVFMSQGCYDQETKQFMKDFCVSIGLVSKEENGDNQIFSFRHIMLQTLLAAVYVSTLERQQRREEAEKLKSANNFTDFLTCINPY
ncbi:hypothetical protein ACJMK2_019385 [Sinanodonta woodiana]|uniref:Uncharacterized protein n=1 Tax=Sinanodonta woodiana TaxID=1069815 RepID=A0ABD3UG89_SINWO